MSTDTAHLDRDIRHHEPLPETVAACVDGVAPVRPLAS